MELKGFPENQVHIITKDEADFFKLGKVLLLTWVLASPQVLLGHQGSKACPARRDRRETRGIRDSLESKGRKVSRESVGILDFM